MAPWPHWWRFLPSGERAPRLEDLKAAAEAGAGAFSRSLRDVRAVLGSGRAAALLKAFEAETDRRRGQNLRVLLVTAQQPRSLDDALTLGFAVAGFAVELVAVEGVAALHAALSGEAPQIFDGIDLCLLSLQEHQGFDDADRAALVTDLAGRLAARTLAPVGIARFLESGDEASAEALRPGVESLDIPLGGAAALDERFGATFGAILAAHAADRLGDAVAAFAARVRGLAPKLVVTDLDGTLWAGVLGEGEHGAAEPRRPPLNRGYAEALARLREKGLVLAIASRNDPADVDAAFAGALDWPLGAADFAASAVGWEDKGDLVAEVLAALALAPDHAVFIDDDPVNCAKVAARFPAMDVRLFAGSSYAFAAALRADPLLAGGEGGGGGERAAQYRRRADVERLRAETPDIAAFLARLGTRVTIRPLAADLLPRASELAARVNQFRFTSLRPGVAQLAARPGGLDFMVRLDDAFGAHGLVGLVLASRVGGDAIIDNLCLSCRALERGVEGAMLSALVRIARGAGLARIVGRIDTLARNEPARDCLLRYGFVDRDGIWVYDLGLETGALDGTPEGLAVSWDGWPGGTSREGT